MDVINTYIDFNEWCYKQDESPFYCEAQDDLMKLKPVMDYGTTSYSYMSSMISLSSVATTSTTTL